MKLRTRLVLSVIGLVAVVGAVIAVITTIVLQSYLYHQLDDQVHAVASREGGPRSHGLEFVAMPGQPIGTLGAIVDGHGKVTDAAVSREGTSLTPFDRLKPLKSDQIAAFADIPHDSRGHNVDIPGLGDYRVAYVTTPDDDRLLVGLPTQNVRDTVNTLLIVECCVTAAGLLAAGLAGTGIVSAALRPLRRVAATAARVSRQTLDRGEVRLSERVPERDTDPRTEIGQVGGALNRMLDHVGAALEARHDSETRVRRFVADASHELRTPLASIRGYAELTRRGTEDPGPDTRHALGRIESEATRMTGLVEDLLLLAHLDSGRPLSMEEVDVCAQVMDAFADARAAGGDHHYRLELPDRPVVVSADAARLHQVLVNLLANARTHTPPGTTVTGTVAAETDAAVITIADDGPGIPESLVPHLFERFTRGDASRWRGTGGTGLGLAIAEAVVTAHNGSIAVDTGADGTSFAIRLPVSPAPSSSG
jgi:two-component system OmpR family sensor kinase